MPKANENKPKRVKKVKEVKEAVEEVVEVVAPAEPQPPAPPPAEPQPPAPPPAQPVKKETKLERMRRELKEAEEEDKAGKLNEKNAKRKALEEQAETIPLEELKKCWVECEMRKTPKAEGGKSKGAKCLCACAVWFPNEEKPKVGKSSYNDVKQCQQEGKLEYKHPITGEMCGVCSKHHAELIIKHGNVHHGWYNQPWGFPEEMLGSKVKKEWVKEIWKRYPVYKPADGNKILAEALK
jgi:hypothetical protein